MTIDIYTYCPGYYDQSVEWINDFLYRSDKPIRYLVMDQPITLPGDDYSEPFARVRINGKTLWWIIM